MAITPSNSSPHLRAILTENIEDAVSKELMKDAVTVFPCGHIFNLNTVI